MGVVYKQVAAFLLLASELGFGWGKIASAPADLERRLICPLAKRPASGKLAGEVGQWLSYKDHDFAKPNWWQPFVKDLASLKTEFPSETYKVTMVDIRNLGDGHYGFRYLGNGQSLVAVSPWSSPKYLAALNAIRRLRQEGLTADSMIGSSHLGDLITTSHTGFATPTVQGMKSNDIGTLFANLGGRPQQDQLVKVWLQRPSESFGGGYGGKNLPSQRLCRDRVSQKKVELHLSAAGGQRNRISTLSFAESLKRIGTHDDEWNNVRFPGITASDLKILFYGHPDRSPGGMLVAFEEPIRKALGEKVNLDQKTKGQWRIFSKTGSAHWVTGKEQLVNALICLPHFDGGRFFAVSIHVKGPVRKLGLKRLHTAFEKIVEIMVPGFAPQSSH